MFHADRESPQDILQIASRTLGCPETSNNCQHGPNMGPTRNARIGAMLAKNLDPSGSETRIAVRSQHDSQMDLKREPSRPRMKPKWTPIRHRTDTKRTVNGPLVTNPMTPNRFPNCLENRSGRPRVCLFGLDKQDQPS